MPVGVRQKWNVDWHLLAKKNDVLTARMLSCQLSRLLAPVTIA